MYLLYINPLGKNYKGEFIYEFIFGKTTEIELGDDWMSNPASSGQPTPPPESEIDEVRILQTTSIELELLINSDNFAVVDGVENIIALAWEKESPDSEKRLVFHFGENMDSIDDKLYERDIVFNDKDKIKN